ncbi:DUF1990 domain-containing protein [Amnibacterium sp. CER49]|uniref:DUF1990 family protein n=1 Tax=Amnibacterium sp. CER49 TaxID=3039161 RepID=UPI0024481BB5|nr:DUF1990 domain-containing protein [Amnibacterium sp. CER49]MDH2442452.1 DUF1990 domain-containing protein [Amnibacterium sp. CER49]
MTVRPPLPAGTVLTDARPPGYRVLHAAAVVGRAEELAGLGEAVLRWRLQRGSGIRVTDGAGQDAPPVALGARVRIEIPLVVALGLRLATSAPAVITVVLQEPDRIGFAYGTLPGHPERGEESFVVARRGDRAVLEVRALSRPAFPYSLAAPVNRRFQRRYSARYLRALLG